MLKECTLILTLATEKQRDMYIGFKEKKCVSRGNVLYPSSPLQVLLTQADSITAPSFGGLRERHRANVGGEEEARKGSAGSLVSSH